MFRPKLGHLNELEVQNLAWISVMSSSLILQLFINNQWEVEGCSYDVKNYPTAASKCFIF